MHRAFFNHHIIDSNVHSEWIDHSESRALRHTNAIDIVRVNCLIKCKNSKSIRTSNLIANYSPTHSAVLTIGGIESSWTTARWSLWSPATLHTTCVLLPPDTWTLLCGVALRLTIRSWVLKFCKIVSTEPLVVWIAVSLLSCSRQLSPPGILTIYLHSSYDHWLHH